MDRLAQIWVMDDSWEEVQTSQKFCVCKLKSDTEQLQSKIGGQREQFWDGGREITTIYLLSRCLNLSSFQFSEMAASQSNLNFVNSGKLWEQPDEGNDCLGKISTSGHVGVDLFSCRCAAGTSRASGDGRRGKRGMRWTTRGRGTCWPATVTPPLWPSLTSGSMWSVGRRFYIGKTSKPQACGFEFKQQMCSTCYWPVCLSWICSYEVQLESRVRRKGLGKFLIQILQLIANR